MTDEAHQKRIVLKLQELEIQLEKLRAVEPKSSGLWNRKALVRRGLWTTSKIV